MRAYSSLVLLLICIHRVRVVLGQVGGVSDAGSCSEKTVCRDCISLPNCLWCSQTDFDGQRCIDRVSTNYFNCSHDEIQDPHSSVMDISMVQSEQISPVALQMNLRVGEPRNFTVRVTPSSSYPLDLYILMDLSRSMQDELNTVRNLTDELSQRLGEITPDFHLGFGAFNEKPIKPFTTPGRIEYYEELGFVNSTDYSYRHVISLTDNVTQFRNAINLINTTSNDDAPEAMLEALLQVAVCGDVIGWRRAARKLVLVMTDNTFHFAGDGKLVGTLAKSDGNCYVPRQTSFDRPVDFQRWNYFDYPSLGQVHAKLLENDVILIIAAPAHFQSSYQVVVDQLTGAYLQVLESGGGGNFLQIIEASYNTTSQTVELVPSPAQGVQFDIFPVCTDTQLARKSACNEVKIGQTVSFEVQVTLTRCIPSVNQSSLIHILGFGSISVQITALCSCPCEAETDFNSTECRGNGHISCGICDCLPGRFGSQCQCTSLESVGRACPVWGTQNRECNGRGLCECGVCICNKPNPNSILLNVTRPRYFGDACECDNFNCLTSNEFVCSGRGECSCGTCSCNSATNDGDTMSLYRGSGCECLPEEEVCLNPADSLICSGRGRCLCDECFCDEDFGGDFCNISTRGLQLECNGRTCVECTKDLLSSSDCNTQNCSSRVVLIDEVDADDYSINGLQTIECSFVDSSGCRHYYFIADSGQIEAEKTQTHFPAASLSYSELSFGIKRRPELLPLRRYKCPEIVCSGVTLAIPIWAIAAIIVGGLLLIGLIVIICIKLILFWQDRREYKAWTKELNEADFGIGQNPLYTSCKQEYKNIAWKFTPTSGEIATEQAPKGVDESLVEVNKYSLS